MDPLFRQTYDDFYVAYFNSRGDVIYPSNAEEVKIIKEMLKHITSDNFVFIEERNLCYKLHIKRQIMDDQKVQVVELSNVTEFFNQVTKASVDEITHLNNRKVARNLFMQYIENAYHKGENFSLIMADLDDFKSINDTYGHTNGDIVLSEVSRILFCSTRQERRIQPDIVARIGGDEFVIVMKNIPEEISLQRAEKIRESVEEHRVALFSETSNMTYISVGTLSMGVYHVTWEELDNLYRKGNTTDQIRTVLLDRCDSALYSSKENGKNQVTVYSDNKTRVRK